MWANFLRQYAVVSIQAVIFKISTAIMDVPGEAKYGFTREQLTEGFKYLKSKGVKHFGIHAFLASNTKTNDYYPALARSFLRPLLSCMKRQAQISSSLTYQVV